METQNRLKSKVVWLSIVSILLPIIGHFGLYEKVDITQEQTQLIIDAVFAILTTLGVLNNPTNKNGA